LYSAEWPTHRSARVSNMWSTGDGRDMASSARRWPPQTFCVQFEMRLADVGELSYAPPPELTPSARFCARQSPCPGRACVDRVCSPEASGAIVDSGPGVPAWGTTSSARPSRHPSCLRRRSGSCLRLSRSCPRWSAWRRREACQPFLGRGCVRLRRVVLARRCPISQQRRNNPGISSADD